MDSKIDFRSDTVTTPTPAMLHAMANAEVGDDVYGEDPTVTALEELACAKLGFEAALYASSGTQSNLLALMTHCERGDEYIVGQQAHTYKYEGGGAAVLGSIQPQPLEFRDNGTIPLEKIESAIKQDDFHFAKTKLIALENTVGGRALPMDYLAAVRELADSRSLALHLDGARLFNASVYHGIAASEITRYFDSVSVCLSKGLCAPIGSVLCGSAELIGKARRWRKVLGGGMRQVGYIAAAGVVALNENIERLQQDHDNAQALFEGLQPITEFNMTDDSVQTNMVFLDCGEKLAGTLAERLSHSGIIISTGPQVRLVVHKDISTADIDVMVGKCREIF